MARWRRRLGGLLVHHVADGPSAAGSSNQLLALPLAATLAPVAQPYDPFDERPDRSRQISHVTRRDIFDYLRDGGRPWWGRMDEVAFLARLYDLEALPSTDSRYQTASRDIAQHRVMNEDWDDDWVFSDSRFQLVSGPDEVLLGFLAQMTHPVVQPDTERAAEVVSELNLLLKPDGWMLKPQKQISGRPVYAPARTGSAAAAAVSFAYEAAVRIDAEYISQQVTRMEGAVDTEPELAIGTAKEFVESICKTILDERQEPYGKNDDIPALVRKTAKVLQLTPADIPDTGRAAETIKRMLMNLATLVQGSAELRNAYGTGHGRSQMQARRRRLTARHARLAVGSAATLGVFLYETHEERG
jgi:hypothetical protein